MTDFTHSDLREIAEQAASTAVKTVLLSIGIDADEPITAQGDFLVLREVGKLVRDPEFRKDLERIRSWRLAQDAVGRTGLVTAVGVLVTGLLGALWVGFKQYLPHP